MRNELCGMSYAARVRRSAAGQDVRAHRVSGATLFAFADASYLKAYPTRRRD